MSNPLNNPRGLKERTLYWTGIKYQKRSHAGPVFTARHRSWGRIMFSVMSFRQLVILSMQVPMWSLPWCIGPHCTGPAPSPDTGPHCTGTLWPHLIKTWDPSHQPCPQLVTSNGHSLRPVQTCSHEAPHTDIWWLLKHVWLASRQYVSYWSTFLFESMFCGWCTVTPSGKLSVQIRTNVT